MDEPAEVVEAEPGRRELAFALLELAGAFEGDFEPPG